MVPPGLAHLQLQLGRVQIFFIPVPQEHDHLTSKFSEEGLKLWDKYFSPHSSFKENEKNPQGL
jgi:hypothetical protein